MTTTVVNFILDRTGSMQALRDETISGFNEYVRELRESGGRFRFYLTQFDSIDPAKVVHDGVALGEVTPLTKDTYVPRGLTPLYDAVGASLVRLQDRIKRLKDPRVITVIVTDGQENASREWTDTKLNALIKEREAEGWAFIYHGAAEDAWDTPDAFLETTMVQNSVASSGGEGMAAAMDSYSGSTVAYAAGAAPDNLVSDEQKREIKDA